MTKQANNSKQTPNTLPENIRKSFEKSKEPITSSHYCGNHAIKDGGKEVYVPTFKVNETYYVYVFDAERGIYQYATIAWRQKVQREFGKNVRKLMDEYGLSWELSKAIFKLYSADSVERRNACKRMKEVRERISSDDQRRAQFTNEPEEAMRSVIRWYDLNYWLDTNNRQVYNALKNYLFAIN